MRTIVASLLLLGLMASDVSGQWDSANARSTLAGLRTFMVGVEGLRSEDERAGLTAATLRTDVELKLRQAGIRVVSASDDIEVGGILVTILTVDRSPGGFAYSVQFDVLQRIRLDRAPQHVAPGKTWGAREVVGTVGTSRLVTVVREAVKDMADEFLNAYLTVNPR